MTTSVRSGLDVLTTILLLCGPTSAWSVAQAPGAPGQVLLFPYYTAQGSNDTVFSVTNRSYRMARAYKVRFYEARNSRVVLDFNLYLNAYKTWTAAVTRGADGMPVLRTYDPACTVPASVKRTSGARELAFGNASYAGYDQAGAGLERAMEGHFEVIEMGILNPLSFDGFYAAMTPTPTNPEPPGCDKLVAAWAPGGAFTQGTYGVEPRLYADDLWGQGMVINVPEGTQYSFDPVVLQNVFSGPWHTAPGDPHPNLADAAPRSVVIERGEARISTWDRGIDAVNAVLMHQVIGNEYVGPPTQQAPVSSDLIVTFPTWNHHVVRESDTGRSTSAPFPDRRFDDLDVANAPLAEGASGGACFMNRGYFFTRSGLDHLPDSSVGVPGPDDNVGDPPGDSCWKTNVISIGNVFNSALGVAPAPGARFQPSGSGWVWLFLNSGAGLTSREGHVYRGLPVIGFAAHRRVNGNLGGVLANYGGTTAHRYPFDMGGVY